MEAVEKLAYWTKKDPNSRWFRHWTKKEAEKRATYEAMKALEAA
jgi:hypothetical protein